MDHFKDCYRGEETGTRGCGEERKTSRSSICRGRTPGHVPFTQVRCVGSVYDRKPRVLSLNILSNNAYMCIHIMLYTFVHSCTLVCRFLTIFRTEIARRLCVSVHIPYILRNPIQTCRGTDEHRPCNVYTRHRWIFCGSPLTALLKCTYVRYDD